MAKRGQNIDINKHRGKRPLGTAESRGKKSKKTGAPLENFQPAGGGSKEGSGGGNPWGGGQGGEGSKTFPEAPRKKKRSLKEREKLELPRGGFSPSVLPEGEMSPGTGDETDQEKGEDKKVYTQQML